MRDHIVFGPYYSFYDEDEEVGLQILSEMDGIFIEFRSKSGQVAGCTVVLPDLESLIKILKKEKKRLQSND